VNPDKHDVNPDKHNWREDAACRDEDPELFFPIGTTGPAVQQTANAKAVCARCPVRETCLNWALDNSRGFGVWGGMDPDERDLLRRRTRARERRRDKATAA
jgi:WhiB family redox-sensing transcriptional regulator